LHINNNELLNVTYINSLNITTNRIQYILLINKTYHKYYMFDEVKMIYVFVY